MADCHAAGSPILILDLHTIWEVNVTYPTYNQLKLDKLRVKFSHPMNLVFSNYTKKQLHPESNIYD